MAAAMNPTLRLQKIFEAYDVNGDGTLSEEEMTQVFEQLGIKGSSFVFKQADKNKDGTIQVHEFISWLTRKDPKCSLSEDVTDGQGSVSATITNTNTKVKKKFYFEFTSCKNIEFSEGKTVCVALEPGEQKTLKLLTVTGEPYHYAYELACRSEYTGVQDDPNAFEDPEFPHDSRSIKGHTSEIPADVWVRARMLGDPSESVLFDQIRPQDVKQGQVGDCWLMASIAAVASHPELIKKLFNTKHVTEDGKYSISLYDAGAHEWTSMVIDEFLPCRLQNGKPAPLFAKPLGEELWAVLLEKAFAKFCYSWGKLAGGDSWFALQAMTGFKSYVHWFMRDQRWKKKVLKEDWAHGKTENARGRKINYLVFDVVQDSSQDLNELFDEIHALGTKDHLMTCSMEGANAEAKAKGIVVWHAYSLLEVLEEVLDDGTPIRLMQVRNPWGFKEWTGDWGDSSELWNQNPQLQERLQKKRAGGNDGKAFMSLEDWGKSFNQVSVCPIHRPSIDVTISDAAPTGEEPEGAPRNFVDSDDEAEGPKEWIQW